MSLSPTALITLLQAKQYTRLDAAASVRVDMENVGTGNGSNKAFALDYAPIEGSLKLYVDFALKVENTDFTIRWEKHNLYRGTCERQARNGLL